MNDQVGTADSQVEGSDEENPAAEAQAVIDRTSAVLDGVEKGLSQAQG